MDHSWLCSGNSEVPGIELELVEYKSSACNFMLSLQFKNHCVVLKDYISQIKSISRSDSTSHNIFKIAFWFILWPNLVVLAAFSHLSTWSLVLWIMISPTEGKHLYSPVLSLWSNFSPFPNSEITFKIKCPVLVMYCWVILALDLSCTSSWKSYFAQLILPICPNSLYCTNSYSYQYSGQNVW